MKAKTYEVTLIHEDGKTSATTITLRPVNYGYPDAVRHAAVRIAYQRLTGSGQYDQDQTSKVGAVKEVAA